MKRLITVILLLTVLLQQGLTGLAAAEPVSLPAVIQRECQWLGSLQQPSGAIIMTRDKTADFDGKQYYRIDPYNANVAVWGMLASPSGGSIQVAKAWIGWYLAHLNSKDKNGLEGTVYTFLVDPATNAECSTGSYQSSSAYAATFLMLLESYAKNAKDDKYLTNNRVAIESIAGAMLATLQPDNLVFVSPENKQQLLMDNCEVFAGLAAAAYLESEVFGDYCKARAFNSKKSAVQKAILNELWNKTNQNFDYALHSPSSWLKFYPDTVAQMYPVLTGVIEPSGSQAKNLYAQLNLSFPNWPGFAVPERYNCSVIAAVAARLDDKPNVNAYMAAVRDDYISTGHPWPWFNAEAGLTVLAGATLAQQMQPQPSSSMFVPAMIIGTEFFAFGPRRW